MVVIDLLLSADNAIIIGMAVAGLPPNLRRKAIILGIALATILRILFALITYQLLQIIGLTLAGGLLLLWVSYKMWHEARKGHQANQNPDTPDQQGKTMLQAAWIIIVADFALSLDNVLAVAGAAHDSPIVLIFGLALSVLLMAFAANFLASLLERYHWLVYVGIVVVLYVALEMIYRGYNQVSPYVPFGLG